MQTRDFTLKVKTLDEAGTFTGLASTYGPPADWVGDIIAPGAYKKAVASQGDGFPLLWCHDQSQPLGLAKVADSEAGLVVTGRFTVMADPVAQRVYAYLLTKAIKGISIGYSLGPGEGKVTYSDDGTRHLKEVFLHEISLCAVPANPGAVVTTVKSLAQVENVLRTLRPGHVTVADLDQLHSIDLTLKALLRKDGDCSCECDDCVAGNCEDCSDQCGECEGDGCAGCVVARQEAAEVADALKAFAMELKGIV